MPLDLNQPQIAAAIVGGSVAAVVSLIVATLNQISLRTMHRQRITADEALAERKITADINLADRRFRYDREFNSHKRRVELVEEVLGDFYEARDIINFARGPLVYEGEGTTRKTETAETEADTRALNAHYVAIERLQRKDDFFAEMLARRYRFVAQFGEQASLPYEALMAIQRKIVVASRMLLETYEDRNDSSTRDERKEWRKVVAWSGATDPLPKELDEVVKAIEAMCRPAIQEDWK